jgi:DNA modification methylase
MSISHKIVCGNTDKLIHKVANSSVDLVITDPPYKDYQSNRPTNNEQNKKIKKGSFSFKNLINEIDRVLKPERHFYIWCDARTYPELFTEVENNKSLKFKSCLVWVKNNHGSGDLKSAYAPQHELCLFGCKGLKSRPFFTHRRPDVLFKKDVNNNVLFYPRIDPKLGGHPTMKPCEILIDFILRSSKSGETVFDPYAGSFSTAISAKRTKRSSLSFELDTDYCSKGRKSLARIK